MSLNNSHERGGGELDGGVVLGGSGSSGGVRMSSEDAEKLQFEQLIGDILYDIIVNSDTVREALDGNRNNDPK